MLTSLVLDALLILIVVMMVPLGFLRGGLRELSTSAALLLGILMAGEWAERWATLLTRWTDMGEASARFAMSATIVVVITGLVGYGGSAAFSWRPGPGGRGYGAYLALLNALVFIGYLINVYIDTIFDGQVPETIDRAYLSRALSVGFEWVLLAGTLGILGATLFGMLVRERGDDPDMTYGPTPEDMYHVRYEPPRPNVRPLNDPEETQVAAELPAKLVRIREVRHWEDEAAGRPRENAYGSGWRQTWPDDQQPTSRSETPAPPAKRPDSRPASSGNQRDVLRDWMRSGKDRSGES
jgi:hypothetical protein